MKRPFVLGGLVAAALLSLSSLVVLEVVGEFETSVQAAALAEAARDLEARFFLGHRPELEWLAARPEVRQGLRLSASPPGLVDFLDHARGLLGLEVVYLVSASGQIVIATDPQFVGVDVAERVYYRRGLAGLPSYALAIGHATKTKGLYASVPVFDRGAVLGLIVFRTSADVLEHWQASIPGLVILDEEGKVFSALDRRWSSGVDPQARGTQVVEGESYRIVRQPLDVVPGFVLASLRKETIPWTSIIVVDLLVLFVWATGSLGARLIRLARDRRNDDRDRRQREMLLSHLMEGIAVFDAETKLVWSNPAFDQLIQRDPDGPSPTMAELWDRRGEGPWCEVVEGKRPWVVFESVLRGNLGAWIPVSAGFTSADGGYLLSVLDGSERYRSDQLLRQSQKLTVLGQLSGGIAHDLNNMLGVLMGMADLLKMSLPDQDPLQDSVDLILTTLTRAASLSERMLNFARQTPINRVPVDMTALLRELRFLARTALPEGTEAEVFVPEGRVIVIGDENLLLSALLNLVLNAGEAMPHGGVVQVNASRMGTQFVLIVEDSGIGMDKATLGRIFEPFFSTKLDRKGTGLGLSLVRRTLLEHHGTIDVHSEPGKGTRVTVSLPLAPEAPIESQARG